MTQSEPGISIGTNVTTYIAALATFIQFALITYRPNWTGFLKSVVHTARLLVPVGQIQVTILPLVRCPKIGIHHAQSSGVSSDDATRVQTY
jgi:hypothetical protein